MKISISANKLSAALAVTGRVIPSQGIVPIIQNYRFVIEGKKLSITGSNMDMFINQTVELDGSDVESLNICLDASSLSELLKNLKGHNISMEFEVIQEGKVTRYEATVKSPTGDYVIPAESGEFYPKMALKTEINYDLECGAFMDAVSRASVAAKIQSKAIDHMLIEMGNGINVVAVDGNILIRKSVSTNTVNNEKIIIPKTSADVLIAMPCDEMVNMSYNRAEVYFDFNNGTSFSCRRMEGEDKYPDVNQVIPTNPVAKAIVNVEQFKSSIRRAIIFANKTSFEIMFFFDQTGIILKATDIDFGKAAKEQVTCDFEGEDMSINMNAKFLIDVLNQVKTENTELYLQAPDRPLSVLEQDTSSKEFIGLVMPLYKPV
jgi:DNA polymerase-3 subunit beta